ncbi:MULTISPECIES: GNAT family N-acetyltransferase [Paenibacillus]|uniref:GNAT family N-acetyltransferase n=1 Tax=Paenibacillus TaxID=44249 RepID=UPI000DC45B62|nr:MULTISPECIES: GNAT family N-acetyltransferase [Paenibacillus]MBU5347093.1 GNAT family N-acetyltransferase [Paenibacillus lautus]RAR45868.1 GNAT family N-acetyltransferase [Paenibacillus sp. MDMC362]
MNVTLRVLDNTELKSIWKEAFQQQNIMRPDEYYDLCEYENQIGKRVTLLAFVHEELAGVSHLKYESSYPYFREQSIPEINDLNVFPDHRRNGIANRIIEEFENIVRKKMPRIGIGVGLYRDYGAAQRIYVRRGYIPDGNGIMYNNESVVPGDMVCADDDLNLYLIKELV